MKKALPVVLLVVAIAVGLAIGIPLAFSYFSKPTAKKSAETFLKLISTGSYSTASDHMTRAHRRRVNETSLDTMAEESGLAEFSSVEWVQEKAKDRRVELDGVVKLNNGETLVIRVNMLQNKDDETWQVDAIIPKSQGEAKKEE